MTGMGLLKLLEKYVNWVLEPWQQMGWVPTQKAGSVPEILANTSLSRVQKIFLLRQHHGMELNEAAHLIDSKFRAYFDVLKNTPPEKIVLNISLSHEEKIYALENFHGYSATEAQDLVNTALREMDRAKLRDVKRKISQKVSELYNTIPVDDRQPIPDDVKTFVWQRDRGKCVKCGSNERLEFDHIIPFSKGGSNTERNLQLLCEKCNREKSAKI